MLMFIGTLHYGDEKGEFTREVYKIDYDPNNGTFKNTIENEECHYMNGKSSKIMLTNPMSYHKTCVTLTELLRIFISRLSLALVFYSNVVTKDCGVIVYSKPEKSYFDRKVLLMFDQKNSTLGAFCVTKDARTSIDDARRWYGKPDESKYTNDMTEVRECMRDFKVDQIIFEGGHGDGSDGFLSFEYRIDWDYRL